MKKPSKQKILQEQQKRLGTCTIVLATIFSIGIVASIVRAVLFSGEVSVSSLPVVDITLTIVLFWLGAFFVQPQKPHKKTEIINKAQALRVISLVLVAFNFLAIILSIVSKSDLLTKSITILSSLFEIILALVIVFQATQLRYHIEANNRKGKK